MKTTLTKNDPVGWYACNHGGSVRGSEVSFWWNGDCLSHGPGHSLTLSAAGFTNFRLLVEAPFTYVELLAWNSRLRSELDKVKGESIRNFAEAKFYETQARDVAALATAHGWVPGSPLADWLKGKLEPKPKPTDQHIGTQDTSDMPGLGDGCDTWEAPAQKPNPAGKSIPDSPGQWHHLPTAQVIRAWVVNEGDAPVLFAHYLDTNGRAFSASIARIERFRCDEYGWFKAILQPELQGKLSDMQKVISELESKLDSATAFCCPKCGGTHFGTQNVGLPFSQWVRECHDQFGTGCKWTGKDADCILLANAAALRLSLIVENRQWQLTSIGRIAKPAGTESIVEAVQRLQAQKDGLSDFRQAVLEAAKPESPENAIDTIKCLRLQRDKLREELQAEVADNQRLREKVSIVQEQADRLKAKLLHIREQAA